MKLDLEIDGHRRAVEVGLAMPLLRVLRGVRGLSV